MRDISKKSAYGAAAVLFMAMLLTIVITAIILKNKTEEIRENQLRSAAQLVDGAITKAFIRPTTVAKVMSEDLILKEYLQKAGNNAAEVEKGMSDYLSALRDGLGYKMMFAVCNDSGAYFTCDGISSYLNKNNKDYSGWYGDFINSGKTCDFDVDTEESAGWALSVFVNQIVYDDNKNLLGVCGTGVEMMQLQNLLQLYERIYQIKIDVTDETGLIQIDTDGEKIEKAWVSLPERQQISDGEYYYEINDKNNRVISYMKDLDMYLIVANAKKSFSTIFDIIKFPALVALIGALISAALLIYAGKKSL